VVNVPANSKVLIDSTGGMFTTSAAATGYSAVDVFLTVDGAILGSGQGYARLVSGNNAGTAAIANIVNWSIVGSQTLAPGNHTFAVAVAGANAGGSAANVSAVGGQVHQGELVVTVIKQ